MASSRGKKKKGCEYLHHIGLNGKCSEMDFLCRGQNIYFRCNHIIIATTSSDTKGTTF